MNKSLLAIVIASVIISTAGAAETPKPKRTQIVTTDVVTATDALDLPEYLRFTEEDKVKAEMWKLSESEWLKYKQIMALNPRGVWSPDLDPVTTLGVEAKTESERRKYARIWLELEEQRQMKELAFEDVKNQMIKEKYPDSSLFKSYREVAYPDRPEGLKGEAFGVKRRTVMFVDAMNCSNACEQGVKDIIASNGDNHQLDIFVIGTNNNDLLLREFATRVGVPKPKVESGRLTLNHDTGSYALSGVSVPLPVVIHIDAQGESVVGLPQ